MRLKTGWPQKGSKGTKKVNREWTQIKQPILTTENTEKHEVFLIDY